MEVDQLPRLGKRELVFCCCLHVIMWFLFVEVSSTSGCLGRATLFYCGTLRTFHIIILQQLLSELLIEIKRAFDTRISYKYEIMKFILVY